jgi:hypothetical protein
MGVRHWVVTAIAVGLLAACGTPDEGDSVGAPLTSAGASAVTGRTSMGSASVTTPTVVVPPPAQQASMSQPGQPPPTPTPTTRRPSAAPPPKASPTLARPTPAPAAAPAALASPCKAASITAGVVDVRNIGRYSDGGPLYATDFDLTNASQTTCSLSGWVGFDMRGDAAVIDCEYDSGGQQIGPSSCGPGHYVDETSDLVQSVTHADAHASVVVLRPGESTQFSAIWAGAICLSPPYRVDLRIPGDSRPITVLRPTLCITEAGMQITSIGQVQASPSAAAS